MVTVRVVTVRVISVRVVTVRVITVRVVTVRVVTVRVIITLVLYRLHVLDTSGCDWNNPQASGLSSSNLSQQLGMGWYGQDSPV